MRWRLCLSELSLGIDYKKGKLNTQADALSRTESLGHTTASLHEDIPTYPDDATAQKKKAAFMTDSAMLDYFLLTHVSFVDTPLVPIIAAKMLRAQQNDPGLAI